MRDPDSVGTHGSNLSKAKPFRADPRLDRNRCLTERILLLSLHLAIPGLRCGLHRCAFSGASSGCTGRRVSLVYCNSQVEVVPHTFLAFLGQTDVGMSDSLQTGFSFFGHPNAAPAGPALRSGWPRLAWPRLAAFPCSAFITGGFRSALYTGNRVSSRRNNVKHPGLDCLPFGSSLSALIWLVCANDAYERSIGFNPVLQF